jgi:hypothetical protein
MFLALRKLTTSDGELFLIDRFSSAGSPAERLPGSGATPLTGDVQPHLDRIET